MNENQNEPTPLNDLGEFGLIERLSQKIQLRNNSTLLGIGDDAALIKQNMSKKSFS